MAAAVILLSTTTAVLAKYITSLDGNEGSIQAPTYFFRSNVMTEESDPTPIAINGSMTTMNLSNGAGVEEFSNVDITYTLKYYVYKDAAWVLAATEADQTLAKDQLSVRTLTLTPITLDGVTYTDVKLEAISTLPFEKTLRARVQFTPTPHAVTYARDGAVIYVTVATGESSGIYTLSWLAGISPDSADENLILNEAGTGPDSVTPTLSTYTTYQFKFFVTDSTLLTELEGGTKQPKDLITVTH